MSISWKRHRLALCVAVVSLGLGAWWVAARGIEEGTSPAPEARHASPTPDREPPPSREEPSPPLPPRRDGMRTWLPGMQYRYAVETTQEVVFKSPQPGGAVPPGMRIHLQGEWSVGVISADDARVEARVRLLPKVLALSVDGQDALTPQVRQSLTASLAMPFFITLEPSGAVRWVHFMMGADVLAQGIQRNLVASTQFVVTGVPKDTWQAEEYDATGQYQATYRRDGGPLQFEKTKQAYSHVATSEGLQEYQAAKLSIQVRSRFTFALAAEDAWVESLQGQEHLEVDAGQSLPKVNNDLQISLRLLDRTRDPTLPGSLKAVQGSLSKILLASFQGQTQDPKERYRRTLAGKRFDDLVNDLRSLPSGEKERDDARTLALERLRALFLLEPAEAMKVPATLRAGMDPIAASPLLGALSAASTPDSIKALAEVAVDSAIGVPVRTDGIAALGMAETPTQQGVDVLREITRSQQPELRDTATLALGNAVYQMRDESSSGAEMIIRDLEMAYRSAHTPEEQAILLRALGNTRDPRALPLIQGGLGSSSTIVRQAAAEALRVIPDPTADQLLSALLLGDISPDVRKAAVFASSFRPLAPLMPALQQALQRDPADAVRAEIVHLLGANLTTVPNARDLLSWSSQSDSNPGIRQLAARFINPVASDPQP